MLRRLNITPYAFHLVWVGAVLTFMLSVSFAAVAQGEDGAIVLAGIHPDHTYGYEPENPVMLGNGDQSMMDRVRDYTSLLELPSGSALMAREITACCADGVYSARIGTVDRRSYLLYFSAGSGGDIYIPRGFAGNRSEEGRIALLDAADYMRQGLDAAAISVLQSHADMGDIRALNELGRIRLQRRQYDDAFDLYSRAAQLGHSEAQAVLASLHEQGRATQADPQEVNYWLREAAASGHTGARMTIALYLLGESQSAENKQSGASLLAMAAEAGNSDAQAALGLMLLDGRVVLQDRLRALFWLSLAGNSGHERARALFRKLSETSDKNMTQRLSDMAEEWRSRPAPSPAISIEEVPSLEGAVLR